MESLLWAEAIPEDAKEAPQGLKPEEEIARFTVWCPMLLAVAAQLHQAENTMFAYAVAPAAVQLQHKLQLLWHQMCEIVLCNNLCSHELRSCRFPMISWSAANHILQQVDEHLSDVERCNLFLTGGHAVQQRRAIERCA
jgi:hypothetical protein